MHIEKIIFVIPDFCKKKKKKKKKTPYVSWFVPYHFVRFWGTVFAYKNLFQGEKGRGWVKDKERKNLVS